MKFCMCLLAVGLLLLGAWPADALDPSASVPGSAAGRWQGTASEFQSIYAGPVSAAVTLDLKPDGTFTGTWKEGSRELSHSGRWHTRADGVVLRADDRSRERLTLRRRGDALYTVAVERFPNGRTTTAAIELHPTR